MDEHRAGGPGATAPAGGEFKAMIMAAGLGTRLYPLTGLTAKPMVPILNRPVMEHMLHLLHRHGVREIAANLHYHPDKIRGYFGDGGDFGVRVALQRRERAAGHGRAESVPSARSSTTAPSSSSAATASPTSTSAPSSPLIAPRVASRRWR
jgi:mannose-1-phosphate guanylyltransferase / phosphomannomutase